MSMDQEQLHDEPNPEELVVFKKLTIGSSTVYDINIPELAENRVPTDRTFLIAFIVVVVLLFPFLTYTLVYSDIDRYYPYDPCGNICGKENYKYDEYKCSGKNFTLEKHMQFDINIPDGYYETLFIPRHCVQECEKGYELVDDSCLKVADDDYVSRHDDIKISRKDEFTEGKLEILAFLNNNAWKLTLSCFSSIGFAVLLLFLFRYATAALVWSILGGALLFGGILIALLWKLTYDLPTRTNRENFFQYMAIVLTTFWLLLFFVVAFMFKKIRLVIALMKEATKVTFDMPRIMLVPIVTFVAQLIILTALLTSMITMFSAGTLTTTLMDGYLYYQRNDVMTFSMFFNFFTACWALQVIRGIQYMVIAGAVSKWYFSKDKTNLGNPILTSTATVFKFHLGSIAFGSLVITIITVLRIIIRLLSRNKILKLFVDLCMRRIEIFIKFLSKNSYILTAMHGEPFYKSGKRAFKIIFRNACRIASINFIGDFVLLMAKVLVIQVSLLIAYAFLMDAHNPGEYAIYFIVLIVSASVAMVLFSTIETCIDTIFLCFCEDSLINDGMARPYAMSRNLMEFVENSKKIYGVKN